MKRSNRLSILFKKASQEKWMIDLDGTITAYPEQMGNLMRALLSSHHQVEVLTGYQGDAVTPDIIQSKVDLLDSFGLSDAYNKLVVVADPKDHVASKKVDYMRHIKATGLVDNDKANVKAARKAGFLALRVKANKK